MSMFRLIYSWKKMMAPFLDDEKGWSVNIIVYSAVTRARARAEKKSYFHMHNLSHLLIHASEAGKHLTIYCTLTARKCHLSSHNTWNCNAVECINEVLFELSCA